MTFLLISQDRQRLNERKVTEPELPEWTGIIKQMAYMQVERLKCLVEKECSKGIGRVRDSIFIVSILDSLSRLIRKLFVFILRPRQWTDQLN